MGAFVLDRLRCRDLGRLPCQRSGLRRQRGLTSPVLPNGPDEIHHTYPRPHVRFILLPMVIRQHSSYHARFMDSLAWVDQTYYQKHKSEDPSTLRATYYAELRMYQPHGDTSHKKPPMDAAIAFLTRFGTKAGISLAVFALSYLPVVGRFVLPAASCYTFNKAVGPVPAAVIFGSGLFLPRRYLVVFLQSYFTSRRLMRELVPDPLRCCTTPLLTGM